MALKSNLFLVTAVLLLFTACSEDKPVPPPVPVPPNPSSEIKCENGQQPFLDPETMKQSCI